MNGDDKQWIEDKQATCIKVGEETLFVRKHDGRWSNCIMELSLLDQIRKESFEAGLSHGYSLVSDNNYEVKIQEAKKEAKAELLDELIVLCSEYNDDERAMWEFIYYLNLERAKMTNANSVELGEKKE